VPDHRFQSEHLDPHRRAEYRSVRGQLLAAQGTLTVASEWAGSPTRVASYVVSGIGFLGGGVILWEGLTVRG
jgi:putative Mg2+ transporter-C (MgtC) family protein